MSAPRYKKQKFVFEDLQAMGPCARSARESDIEEEKDVEGFSTSMLEAAKIASAIIPEETEGEEEGFLSIGNSSEEPSREGSTFGGEEEEESDEESEEEEEPQKEEKEEEESKLEVSLIDEKEPSHITEEDPGAFQPSISPNLLVTFGKLELDISDINKWDAKYGIERILKLFESTGTVKSYNFSGDRVYIRLPSKSVATTPSGSVCDPDESKPTAQGKKNIKRKKEDQRKPSPLPTTSQDMTEAETEAFLLSTTPPAEFFFCPPEIPDPKPNSSKNQKNFVFWDLYGFKTVVNTGTYCVNCEAGTRVNKKIWLSHARRVHRAPLLDQLLLNKV